MEDQPQARLAQHFAQHTSAWALAFTKLSIACMLFRLRQDSKAWRIFLSGMMLWAMVSGITASALLFSTCKPLRAMWDFTTPNFECLPIPVITQGILATAVMAVRTLRERMVVALVMGLGLVASAASICKIVNVTSKNLSGDALVDGVDVTFWGMLETQLAIIAACVPCLKRMMENDLRRLGLMTRTEPSKFYYMDQQNSANATQRNNQTANTNMGNATMLGDLGTDNEDAVPVLKNNIRMHQGSAGDSEHGSRQESWEMADGKM
ncbi:hypothetical protein B0H63DRAFT_534402 [Podospora didyma]|uniref:Rhodopsin domain-containing protein n=1 Tax=Podospora didyma TaxID=330526 RepID=A0AAE0K1E3_9PEZI|nr:hypothetical protein B0H63DRAFT_534402 [Podospora didyma]